jgi:hypothetical protein
MNVTRTTLAALFALSVPCLAQNFIPGNLAVVRLGDGTQTLVNTGNSIFVDQYSTGGAFVNSVAIPDTGAGGMVINGTATADGALSRSPDSSILTVSMYNRAVGGSGSVSTTTSAAVPRTIGLVDFSRTYSQGLSTTTAFSAGNFRSSVGDGNNYWGLGSVTGTYYFGSSASAATIQSTISNGRVINIFNGNLYFSTMTSAASGPGIYGFSGGGEPTAATAPTLLFSVGATGSPYDFAINSAGNLAYVADDRATASGGGIQRWDLVGSTWTLSYTLGTGVGSTVGTRGLAVDFSGATPLVYATTATGTTVNNLIGVADTGAGSVPTVLATSAANEVFRGLEFVAIPEPSSIALLGFGIGAWLVSRRRKN